MLKFAAVILIAAGCLFVWRTQRQQVGLAIKLGLAGYVLAAGIRLAQSPSSEDLLRDLAIALGIIVAIWLVLWVGTRVVSVRRGRSTSR